MGEKRERARGDGVRVCVCVCSASLTLCLYLGRRVGHVDLTQDGIAVVGEDDAC